jgi:hypothetical protein
MLDAPLCPYNPVSVMTISSSIRLADMLSDAGQQAEARSIFCH